MGSSPFLLPLLASLTLFLSVANAHYHPWYNGSNWDHDGWIPPWVNRTDGGYYGFGGNNNNAAAFFDLVGVPYGSQVLIAHAVLASAVWVLLIPIGGILLRLNVSSPWVLRVHAALQIFSYLAYAAAAGLGIWLVQKLSFSPYANLWNDPHPQLGLAILALAFFQPILGFVHHTLFKRRLNRAREGKPGPAPGRTAPGHMHLWLGRILIVLGMVNGGLGIRLAGQTPFQSASATRRAAIVYGVVTGVIALIYIAIVALFEVRRLRRNRAANNDRAAGVTMAATPSGRRDSRDASSRKTSEKSHGASIRYS